MLGAGAVPFISFDAAPAFARERRATLAATYNAVLREIDGLAVPAAAPAGDEHAHHLYPLRVLGGRNVRDRFVQELAARGVMTSVHFIPLHLHPYYRSTYGLQPGDLPQASRLFGQEVSLPLFPGMTPAQVEQVLDAIPPALAAARARR